MYPPLRILLCSLFLFTGSSNAQATCLAIDTTTLPKRGTTTDTSTFICYYPFEVMPQYPGGIVAMRRYMATCISYPRGTEAISGQVMIGFNVIENGSLQDIKVIRSLHPALDSIALTAVRQMPRWKPGIRDGKACKTTMHLPVKFIPQ